MMVDAAAVTVNAVDDYRSSYTTCCQGSSSETTADLLTWQPWLYATPTNRSTDNETLNARHKNSNFYAMQEIDTFAEECILLALLEPGSRLAKWNIVSDLYVIAS